MEVLFGDPRIEGCMHLPEAYRGLLRPSSASEPSYPPDGVACRAYLRAQHPICVRGHPLHGDHHSLIGYYALRLGTLGSKAAPT